MKTSVMSFNVGVRDTALSLSLDVSGLRSESSPHTSGEPSSNFSDATNS
jgi:hypothetical protein